MLRVGRRQFTGGHGIRDCQYPNYTKIVVLIENNIRENEYGSISPYVTKNDRGQIIENIWQFSKIYHHVPNVRERLMGGFWSHPSEQHVNDDLSIRPEYFAWREKGFNFPYPVRYPVGRDYRARASCLYSLKTQADGSIDLSRQLDYIQARKEIYVTEYCKSLHHETNFLQLCDRFLNGENLLIVEVDGPHQESLSYYTKKYGVPINFFEGGTVAVNVDNMKILLNDPKHPFGHGYCLAMEIMGITQDVLN
jgi:hypothetical protein